jgi:hypothetical protein
VGPRAGLNDVEKRKFLTLPRLELGIRKCNCRRDICSCSVPMSYTLSCTDDGCRQHRIMFDESYLLGYNVVQSVESQPTFVRNMSPPRSKNKPSNKPA